MNSDPDTIDPFGDSIDKLRGKFQFLTRIPAGSKSRSHEGSPGTLLRHDDLCQHWLIELNEVAAGIA